MLLDRTLQKKYQSGMKFLLYVAVRHLGYEDINYLHSIDKGLYSKIIAPRTLNNEDIEKIKEYINELINKNLKITKKVVTKSDAYTYYLKKGLYEKAGNIQNLNTKTVTLYELNGYYNYFMSDMPQTTGELKNYRITYLGNNMIVLSTPVDDTGFIPEYIPQNLIIKSFDEYTSWMNKQNIKYVADLNNIISKSEIKSFIKKNDIIMDSTLSEAANVIKHEGKKLILLGGPSSSGKTTTTRKLSLYLSALGLNPIYLSLDDYFVERKDNPKNPDGTYNFECLEAIDLELFNTQINELLEGKTVSIPTFNFITGTKEYKGKEVTMRENDILLIEGLHCLNENLTSNIDSKDKMKIYLSPFIPLNIDRHNHLSTVDMRLIRRIVRDNRTRGYDITKTLEAWESVRAGETKYIFPFTKDADMIINTAYIYEIGVLRVYIEPLLYSVPMDSKFYREAKRLINELQMFFPIPSEYITDTNVLREFIGGSYFEER